MAKRNSIDRAALEKFIKANPGASHSQFIAAGGQKISDVSYYQIRKKLTGGMAVTGRNKYTKRLKPTKVRATRISETGILPPGFTVHEGFKHQYEKLSKFLMENPNAGCRKTVKELNLDISSSSFYRFRDRLKAAGMLSKNGVKNAQPTKEKRERGKKSSVYMPVYTLPINGMNALIKKTTVEALRSFIETLNNSKRVKMEVVEYADPAQIEVREYQ